MNDKILSNEEVSRRYPRLIRAAKWAACLCTTEAEGAIIAHQTNRIHDWHFCGGSEAVAHYGGPQAVLSAAWKFRHWVPKPYVRPCEECSGYGCDLCDHTGSVIAVKYR